MKIAAQFAAVQLLILVLSSILGAVPAETKVSGIVTDSAGAELSHAWVAALPRTEAENIGVVGDRPSPWVQADSHGRFSISLSRGRYKIQAKDEVDGYPDPVFVLNDDPTAKFPELSVQQQDISGVHVMLGKRGAILDGELMDQSGKPIRQGKVTIRDARNPSAYVDVFTDATGKFQFAVPSKPLLISATANDYKTTAFEGGSEITLLEGEHRTIVLELQRQ